MSGRGGGGGWGGRRKELTRDRQTDTKTKQRQRLYAIPLIGFPPSLSGSFQVRDAEKRSYLGISRSRGASGVSDKQQGNTHIQLTLLHASGLYHIMNRAAILTPAARNSPEKTILYFHKSCCPFITSCMKLLGPLSYHQLHWSHEGKHSTFHELYWHYKSWGKTFNISWTLLTLSYHQLHWSHDGNIQHFMNFTDIILSPAALKSWGKHSIFHELYWHYPITSCIEVMRETFNISWTLLTL